MNSVEVSKHNMLVTSVVNSNCISTTTLPTEWNFYCENSRSKEWTNKC